MDHFLSGEWISFRAVCPLEAEGSHLTYYDASIPDKRFELDTEDVLRLWYDESDGRLRYLRADTALEEITKGGQREPSELGLFWVDPRPSDRQLVCNNALIFLSSAFPKLEIDPKFENRESARLPDVAHAQELSTEDEHAERNVLEVVAKPNWAMRSAFYTTAGISLLVAAIHVPKLGSPDGMPIWVFVMTAIIGLGSGFLSVRSSILPPERLLVQLRANGVHLSVLKGKNCVFEHNLIDGSGESLLFWTREGIPVAEFTDASMIARLNIEISMTVFSNSSEFVCGYGFNTAFRTLKQTDVDELEMWLIQNGKAAFLRTRW